MKNGPISGISWRRMNSTITLQPKTASASANSSPPSFMTTIPSFVKWLTIAPLMTPSDSIAPQVTVLGVSNSTDAINSTTPDPIRPHGSNPSVLKMYTDSSAPLNLKNNVCNRINAAITWNVQLTVRWILQFVMMRL